MKTAFRSFCLAAVATLVTASASAQLFVGSDNFDSGSDAAWAYAFRLPGAAGNGELTFTNQRLDFTKASEGTGSYVLGWDGDGAGAASRTLESFSTSWVADLTVTNNVVGLTGGSFNSIGFEIAGSGAQYSALMLTATDSGYVVRAEGSGIAPVEVSTFDSSDVQLRFSWDAGTQALGASYRFDSGAYTSLATFHPVSNWSSGATNSGFFFEVFGNTNMTAVLGGGLVHADNFSVSAIPEPSTYAALAGAAALGLAVWRRRRVKAQA